MKRLIRKAEIYDGFDYKDEYYEVYINPTSSEIETVRKADTYNSIRGIIDQSNNKYIWIGNIGHASINKYINNPIPTDYFRFAYDNGFTIDLKRMGASISYNECKEIIKNNSDFLSQIGNFGRPIIMIGLTDKENYLYYNSVNEFLNEEDKKVGKLIEAINIQLHIGDQVQWKRHPYDNSVYEVKEILPNGNVFIDNGITAFTDIKPSVLKFVERSAE